MKRIIHWYRAWKFLKLIEIKKQKEYDEAIKSLVKHLKKMNRAKPNPYRFGWSYFNKHRGWNWLGGLTRTER